MTERTVRTSVEFRHPFRLIGIDETLPRGVYEIETVEEPIDSLSVVGWRRVSTTITVQERATMSRQLTTIDPADLAAALAKDMADQVDPT